MAKHEERRRARGARRADMGVRGRSITPEFCDAVSWLDPEVADVLRTTVEIWKDGHRHWVDNRPVRMPEEIVYLSGKSRGIAERCRSSRSFARRWRRIARILCRRI